MRWPGQRTLAWPALQDCHTVSAMSVSLSTPTPAYTWNLFVASHIISYSRHLKTVNPTSIQPNKTNDTPHAAAVGKTMTKNDISKSCRKVIAMKKTCSERDSSSGSSKGSYSTQTLKAAVLTLAQDAQGSGGCESSVGV